MLDETPQEALRQNIKVYATNTLPESPQLCCIVCGYKAGQAAEDCTGDKKDHTWAAYHICLGNSHRCSRWLSGQLQVWSQHRVDTGQASASDSLSESDISSQGPNKAPRSPELDAFLAGINPERSQVGTPGSSDLGGLTTSQRHLYLSHLDSPLQPVHPSTQHESPRPYSSQRPHHRPVHGISPQHFSISPKPTRCCSPKQMFNEVWKRALLNKNNSLIDTYPDAPNNSLETGMTFLSDDPVLDNTAALVNKPPNVKYSPQFDYKLNEDYSRLEASGSPYNYNPSEMTFCKRKLSSSYGSDQSSLSQTPVKHVAKKGKLEKDFLDISGPLGMDITWMPGLGESKDLNRTWMPGRIPSDSDDNDRLQDDRENIDPQYRSLDKTWMPEGLDGGSDKRQYECGYLDMPFSTDQEKLRHVIEVHEERPMPAVCTNCSDNNANVAWCEDCCDDSHLCDPCVWAHRRVGLTKKHRIIFGKPSALLNQRNGKEADPMAIFENILNSVHPGRRINRATKVSLISTSSESDFDGFTEVPQPSANFAHDVQMIRQDSCSLVTCLAKANCLEVSSGHPCADSKTGGLGCHDIKMPGAFNRSSSTASLSRSSSSGASRSNSEARKFSTMATKSSRDYSKSSSEDSRSSSVASRSNTNPLTERIIVDNLLPIFNVGSDEVKTKIAVVIEMLVKENVVNPSLFCDDRCMRGFKSLLSIPDTTFINTVLSSLDQLVTAVGNKGIFFSLVKIKSELSETLKRIQQPAYTKDIAEAILNKLDSYIGI